MAAPSPLRWLASLLAGPPYPAGLEGALASGAVAPETLAETASRHRVSPSLARALREAGLAERLPQEFREYCAALAEINEERNAALAALIRETGAALRASGIDAVLLKGGASLFDAALPHRTERFLLDVDLLVPTAQLAAAEACLRTLGWQHQAESGGEGHQLPPFGRVGAPAAIDLHFALLSPPYEALLPAAEVLAAAVPGPAGLPLRLPSLEHRLVHNIAHAQLADGSLAQGKLELRQLLEFAALARRAADPTAWPAIGERFARHRAGLALDVQMLAAQELLGLPTPLPLRRGTRAGALLARALWLESHTRTATWNDRLLRPLVQLGRSLRQPALRRRLWHNLRSADWRRRQLAMLRKRRA